MLSTNYLMTAEEVAEKLDCSTGHAYKLIRSMNQELKKQGFYVIAGKIPRAFVEQKFFGMTSLVRISFMMYTYVPQKIMKNANVTQVNSVNTIKSLQLQRRQAV